MQKAMTEFSVHPENPDFGIVQVTGMVDLSNVGQFSKFLDQVMATPCKVLIFDLKGLSYMNSTGFGALTSRAMDENEERRIIFCNLEKTIVEVFTMFGLNNVCEVVADRNTAVEAAKQPKKEMVMDVGMSENFITPDLGASDFVPEYAPEVQTDDFVSEYAPEAQTDGFVSEYAPEAQTNDFVSEYTPEAQTNDFVSEYTPKAQTNDFVSEYVPSTDPEDFKSTVKDLPILPVEQITPVSENVAPAPQSTPENAPAPAQAPAKDVFPVVLECPECSKKVNYRKTGHYKCPGCEVIHYVDKDGSLNVVKNPLAPSLPIVPKTAESADEVTVSLPSDTQHLSKIRDFIMSFTQEIFTDQDRANLSMAVDEACSNAIEHAHKHERSKKIHLRLLIYPGKFKITIRDSGENTYREGLGVTSNNVKQTGRGMGFFLMKQMMDEVIIEKTDKGGTAVTLVKNTKK